MEALLLCDDPDEAALLATAIQRAGPSVSLQHDLQRAIDEWTSPDLVVLAMYHGASADDIRAVRQVSEALLLAMVAQPDETIMCRLYDTGADMVLARPYSTRLLITQLRAMLRRGQGTRLVGLPLLSERDLSLDPASRTARIGELAPRRLTQLEYRLLYTLMTHRGQVMPAQLLVERVWGYEGEGSIELVRGLVRRLRAKIEPDPRRPQYVITMPGVGYLLSTEGELEPRGEIAQK